MIEWVLARMWIGGRLRRRDGDVLVRAVCESRVTVGAPGWDHVLCHPVSIDGLMEGTTDDILHLQDDAAPDGDLPLLTEACRHLGLTFRRWHEATTDEGCMVEVWKPGMEKSLLLHGDPLNPSTHLVDAKPIRQAIDHLRKGRVDEALSVLDHACPVVPEVPPLIVVED